MAGTVLKKLIHFSFIDFILVVSCFFLYIFVLLRTALGHRVEDIGA